MWIDEDADGLQGTEEEGLDGVTVHLLDINHASRCKFINLDVNAGGVAVGFWIGAVDTELYGTTIQEGCA